jgi:uroporphyrinogen III methyltransferase/synthase
MIHGFVHLVGAGPGDPDFVTVRARELIETADAVVCDPGVHPGVLAWCRPGCEKHLVGTPPRSPAEIEALLLALARAGKRVVRLKGGDPFVFGNGSDEACRLAKEGIPFAIVPGVTAVLAAGACAGIPLTQRGATSALILLDGQDDPPGRAQAVDWQRYGALPDATLAIYMGMGRVRSILDGLMAGGLPPDTPAAAVQWASLGRQRSLFARAATLADEIEAAKLPAPAIILIGDVVRHHETLDWFEQRPLFGRRVVVTRSRAQSAEWRRRLETLGAEVVELPLVDVREYVDRENTIDVLAGIGAYDWLVFTSANGARHFFDLFFKAFRDLRALGAMRVACVGETTTRAVRSLHIEVEICPETATADALADALVATGSLDNAKVLIVTGNLNRDTLVRKLEGAYAIVDQLQVYVTNQTDLAGDPVAADFCQRGADAVLFASSSAVQSFVAQARTLQLARGAKHPLAGSLGPATSETMRQVGVPVDFEANNSTLDALIAALVAKLASG